MDPGSAFGFYLNEPSAEVDSTLLSLNSDISDTMFNMSDALSALPSDFQILESENGSQTSKRKSKDMSYTYVTPLTIELRAPTSPATLLSEDSLTYLNQDQPYTIEISDSYGEKPSFIKSVVRICFYQERLQVNEAQHLSFWQAHHQGERMLDLDLTGCFNYREAYADPDNLNAVVCIWHSSTPCKLSFKAHCVSTEFTAKKHGGEKGVPFRIQVDSFRECDNSHIYSAACQVKVFKPKGADRKNRTDREKLDKRTKIERQQYRSAAPTTFLEEVTYCPMSRLALNDPAPSGTTEHSVLAALEDFLSSSNQHQQGPPLPPPPPIVVVGGDPVPASPALHPSLLMQCKRSAQDDEGLDASLREISLAGCKTTRQENTRVPLLPPPLKSGRLFNLRIDGESCRNDSLAVVASEVNVDALPFSQCEISEHRACTSSFQPIFSFSTLTTTTTTSVAAAPRPVVKPPQTTTIPSQKRGTTPGDEEVPCPGTCSCCGRACSGSAFNTAIASTGFNSDASIEWSVKRLRRKRQFMTSVRHMRYPRVAAVSQGQTAVVRVPFTTSDYSSHTLEEDNEVSTSQRRPSTSSEASQPLPSDKSSKTKSEEEEEEDEDEEEEDVGEEGDDESEEGAANSPSPSLLPLPPLITLTEPRPSTSTSAFLTSTTATLTTNASHSVGTRPPRSSGVSSTVRRARAAIRPEMSRAAVSNWLRASGFGSLRSKFAKFSGVDMIRLNRSDLIRICGTVEGIRLSNAILQKPPRATCTIFVRRDSESVFHAIYLYHQTESELRIRLSTYLKLATASPQGISIVLKKSPGLDVAVTDEVVAYFDDQSCFSACVSEAKNAEEKKTVFMQKL